MLLNCFSRAMRLSAVSVSAWRSAGKKMLQEPVTTMLAMPPMTTARTAPHQWAVRPLSYSPTSLDTPMKSQLMLETRPRI